MSATVCTCIRAANIRDVAVPDPDCPACTRRQQQGITPTFVIYDETAQADRDAHRAATGLGWLLLWTAALLLAAAGICAASLWPGTPWSAIGALPGTGLLALALYRALFGRTTR